ncbi:MAG: ATP-binding cassette domain-containing protein, partial [Myxococcota bacterium]
MSAWELELRLRLGTLTLEVALEGDEGVLALVGPNGAGKSTLLRTLAGAHRPEAGRIALRDAEGESVLFDAAKGLDLPPEARRVGYVPQGYGLFPHLSALDNVAFGADRETARAMLASLGAEALAGRRPGALSGGERQRVALARALVAGPRLLLLDEPLAALDLPARRRLRRVLAGYLRERSLPALVVTHDLRDLRALGARVAVLEGGRIVQTGTPDALAQDPASEFVAELFGEGG